MKSIRIMKLSGLFVMMLYLVSCRRDSQSHWNTDVLVPIANTTLSIQNLVKDSSIQTNSDNSLTLAFNSNLYQFNLANNIINIPDTGIGKLFTLDSLTLANQFLNYSKSLGNIALSLLASGNDTQEIEGLFILSENDSMEVIRPVNNINIGAQDFSVGQFFDSAVVLTGVIQVVVVNNLPIPFNSGSICTLRNKGESSIISQQVLDSIPANQSTYFSLVLPQGALIKNQLEVTITNLNTPGSNGQKVLIDTADYIEFKLFLTKFLVSEAWAVFPNETALDQTEQVSQTIRDRKLTFVEARSGFVYVYISSNVPQPLTLTYYLVGAYDSQGRPLVVKSNVSAAPTFPPGATSLITDTINISGYSINLTGVDGDQFNTYTQRVVATLDSNGTSTHITNKEGITVTYTISKVAPNYVKGYLGRDTINAIDTAAFSFLNVFQSGKLDLSQVTMNFDVQNGLGVPGQVKINSLSANSPVNGTVALHGSILNTPLSISSASDFPLRPGYNTYALNSTGNAPNLPQLLDILPNEVQYNVQVQTNVKGNNQQYQEFVYLESGLNINLDAQIPLSLIASNLVLLDTLPFNLSNANLNVNGITDGIINLVAENKFPIVPVLTMIVYDSTWAPVDTLLLKTTVAAGLLDANCMVDAPKQTVIQLPVSQARLNNIKRGRNAIITANFSTSSSSATCNGQHLKIYSNYNLGITFTAKFNYEANAKF